MIKRLLKITFQILLIINVIIILYLFQRIYVCKVTKYPPLMTMWLWSIRFNPLFILLGLMTMLFPDIVAEKRLRKIENSGIPEEEKVKKRELFFVRLVGTLIIIGVIWSWVSYFFVFLK